MNYWIGSKKVFIWQEGDLNTEQVEAISEPENVFLVACPGSGKTRTLTYKIAYELSRLESEKHWIIAITYTNRAASEIQDRIENLGVSTDQLWIGTIHSFCLEWIIKPYGIYHEKLKNGYRIVNSHDTETILTELCSQCPPPKISYYDCAAHFYTSAGINISCTDNRRPNIDATLAKYKRGLELNSQIDFELILWYSYELITQNPSISGLLSKIFSYILIDEYQDTREIQYQIISAIFDAGYGGTKAFVVGDPNQSIFTSLGGYAIPVADLSRMSGLTFKQMVLSINYRSSQLLVDFYSDFKVHPSAAISESEHKNYGSLISYNQLISREDLTHEIARLIRINIDRYDISPPEICVIGPWWIHLAALTRGLVNALPDYRFNGPGLTPFVRDVENFWYRLARIVLTKPSPKVYVKKLRWAKELIETLSDAGADVSLLNAKDLLRIINDVEITEQDGLTFLSKFFDDVFSRIAIDASNFTTLVEHRIAFFDSAQARIARIQNEGINYAGGVDTFYRAFEDRDGITISTIHGVKGAEFDVVIAFALLNDVVPHFSDINKSDSAKKLLYVISSRARKHLHLISETGRNQRNPTPELQQLNHSYSIV